LAHSRLLPSLRARLPPPDSRRPPAHAPPLQEYGTHGSSCFVLWFRRMLRNWDQLIVPRQQLRWNDGSSAACLPRLQVFQLEELEVDVKAQMVRRSRSTRQRLSFTWSASLDSQDAFKVSATDLTWSSDLPVLGSDPERAHGPRAPVGGGREGRRLRRGGP
ncbi:unnamed protein product, partial [Prorocentrum cordatum]